MTSPCLSCSIGNTSSIRVHCSASYVTLLGVHLPPTENQHITEVSSSNPVPAAVMRACALLKPNLVAVEFDEATVWRAMKAENTRMSMVLSKLIISPLYQ